MKKKLLILCTGNSCRSQMAEGWFRHVGGDVYDIYSAGVEIHGVNPDAIKVMKEAGIDISTHTSNHIDEYNDLKFDTVITVCDNARKRCPVFSSNAEKIHHNFDDPAGSKGTRDEKLETFRRVRDEIRSFAKEFLRRD